MVTSRKGASSLGCLFMAVIIGCAVYVGIGFGGKYWAFYQFQDDMRQQVRFAAHSTNDATGSPRRCRVTALCILNYSGALNVP